MKFRSTLVFVILLSTLTACGKKGSESAPSNPEVVNPSTGVVCKVDFYKGQELSEVAMNAYRAMKECGLTESEVIAHVNALTK